MCQRYKDALKTQITGGKRPKEGEVRIVVYTCLPLLPDGETCICHDLHDTADPSFPEQHISSNLSKAKQRDVPRHNICVLFCVPSVTSLIDYAGNENPSK